MKKIVLVSFILIICMLGLTGCGIKYPNLSDDSIAFNMGEYIDTSDDNAGYGTIEYNGRIYVPYGTLKGTLKRENITKCIGYIVQKEDNNEDDKDTRVYTLTEDPNENYLMVYYIGTTLMNQPDFWRAVDTKNKEVNTPDYIMSLEYNYWK